MAPRLASTALLILMIALAGGLFWSLEHLIGNIPSSYEAIPGSARAGLDGTAWTKVQAAIDGERSVFAGKLDAVALDVAAARGKAADVNAKLESLAAEAAAVQGLSEELKTKLHLLDLDRQAAYSAAQLCDESVASCATPAAVAEACSLSAQHLSEAPVTAGSGGGGKAPAKDLSLKAILADEGGPLRQAVHSLVKEAQAADGGCTTAEYVDAAWQGAVRRMSGDGVGMRDYALEDLGASVVAGGGLTSPTFTAAGSLLSTEAKQRLFGLAKDVGGPHDALRRSTGKGSCFAFNGPAGNLTVRLSEPLALGVQAVSLEHLPKVFSERGGDSAPRAFRVWGYAGDDEVRGGGSGRLLVSGAYDVNGADPIQTFKVPPSSSSSSLVSLVRLEVLSNHGNEDYTCVYRFRVH